MAYANGQLTVLSKPESVGECPGVKNMSIQLASASQYWSRVLFFREERLHGNWRLCQLQPMMLSPVVMLTVLEVIFDIGMFCTGPADPWSFDDSVASASPHAIYWILRAIYASGSPSTHQTLHVQVSTCPFWAFSMPEYHVHFLQKTLVRTIPSKLIRL